MNEQEKIIAKFDELLEFGQTVLEECGWDGKNLQSWPGDDVYQQFRAEVLNIVRRACGAQSDHYRELERIAEEPNARSPACFPMFRGVLRAAYRDFKGGFLFDMRSLIAAELLGDFLAQAEYLLSEGYHVPAASLAGAVLEDTLRKLCDRRGICYPAKTSINALNVKLAKNKAYDSHVQKRLTALADLRNKADHGQFCQLKPADVEDMVRWVRRFAEEYLR